MGSCAFRDATQSRILFWRTATFELYGWRRALGRILICIRGRSLAVLPFSIYPLITVCNTFHKNHLR